MKEESGEKMNPKKIVICKKQMSKTQWREGKTNKAKPQWGKYLLQKAAVVAGEWVQGLLHPSGFRLSHTDSKRHFVEAQGQVLHYCIPKMLP